MFVPVNEMGVVVLFAQMCESMGWEILRIQAGFPDSIVRQKSTGMEFRAEIEYALSSFYKHGHDIRKCDMVICWEKDIDFPLPVIQLSSVSGDPIRFSTPTEIDLFNAQLEIRSLKAALKNAGASRISNRADFRLLPAEDRQIVANMPTAQIVTRYGVSDRTARNWRKAAQNGKQEG